LNVVINTLEKGVALDLQEVNSATLKTFWGLEKYLEGHMEMQTILRPSVCYFEHDNSTTAILISGGSLMIDTTGNIRIITIRTMVDADISKTEEEIHQHIDAAKNKLNDEELEWYQAKLELAQFKMKGSSNG